MAGKDYANGIGAHANSIIEYDLPAGSKRFTARGGIDEGGTSQGGVYKEYRATKVIENPVGGRQAEDRTVTLKRYRVGQGVRTDPLMAANTKLMTDADIDAVVAYVTSMP